MSDKKFTVHVASQRGHDTILVTREDVIQMMSENENTWVFVDSQMVSVEELENIELNDATEIRINPGMVGGAETFTVLVASKEGDEAMLMTKQEISDKLTSNNANWLFVDGQMVDAASIANIDLDQDNVLRLVPSIVGGAETFTVEITDGTGHTVCEMSKEEIVSSAKETDNWVFVDGKMVAASAIADIDLSQTTKIRMTRPLVGGF
jgi:archaellum component FlaG (FlaF/FlaG flagellin family)